MTDEVGDLGERSVVVRMVVLVMVMMMVVAVMRLTGRTDFDVNRRHTCTEHASGVHVVADTQLPEGGAQRVERQAGIKQGAEEHVARRAGKTIEVHHPRHGRILDSLSD